ncbi:MAG: aspartyl protease family protein [Chloracidobacterium sp.]|nr:aspartyl protease family protein [Chloracidobacterium sp.]
MRKGRKRVDASLPNSGSALSYGLMVILLAIAPLFAIAADKGKPDLTDDPKRLLKQAEKLIRRGEFAEAERMLNEASKALGDDPYPKLRLAQLFIKQRRLTEAYDIAFPEAKAEPKNAYAFAVLGGTMLGIGRFRDARALFYSAIRIDKSNAYAWYGYGMLEFYENRINESLANLEEAVYHDPNEPDYVFALAQVSARAERYKAAADSYKRFLSISKDTDDERRVRIRGLINFLTFLGDRQVLYATAGADRTTVPVVLAGNRPVVQMEVNGRDEPLDFVLDTGSGISVISEETAKRLKIRPITKGGFARGIGGDGRFEIVYGFVREVRIGDVVIRNVPVYIRKFHSDGQKIDGYIGLSLISKFLTTLDYGSLTFSLAKSSSGRSANPIDESIALPLRLTSSGFLSGEVQLAGVEAPLNFIVDTGASVSVISDEVASLDAISPHEQPEKMRVIGSAGVTEGVSSFQLPSVSFGPHLKRDITAIALNLEMINEASGFQQAGILGGNFLKNFKLTFDFKNSQVTFSPLDTVP